MPVKITPAQARALGITGDAGCGSVVVPAPRRSRGGDRRRAPAQPAECFDCGERTDGETAQARHAKATGHRRYQLILALESPDSAGTLG